MTGAAGGGAGRAWPALPGKVELMVVLFSYGGQARCEAWRWVCQLGPRLAGHPRVGCAAVEFLTGYPVDRLRNKAVRLAREAGYDFLLMLDDDMHPDYDPGQVPFLPAALDFALAHPGPCVVGAPYCAAPPGRRVLVNEWAEHPRGPDGVPYTFEPYTRAAAARLRGFRRAAALPTGVLLIDLRCLAALEPPYFYYEFKDAAHTELASTEDTCFTRDLEMAGVPLYCAWDSWAGHVKAETVTKPAVYGRGDVPRAVRAAWERDLRENHGGRLPAAGGGGGAGSP